MSKTIKRQVLKHRMPLIGLKLSIARRAGDMRVFHFGGVTVAEDGRGSFGQFALHVQCPWRIEGPDGIVTSRTDLWQPADPDANIDWDTWDCDKDENLQDLRIASLLGGYDAATRSLIHATDLLVVEGVDPDEYGGATISGGYRLVLFPSGSAGEN